MDKIDDFSLYLFRLVRPIYSAHWELVKGNDLKFEDVGTIKEKYIKDVFIYFTTIKDSVEKLKNVIHYLSIDKVPKHYLDNGIEEIEYYRYHIENFHIKCVSIIDYITLLLNHSLKIGIPKNKCGIYSITENTNFKGTELAKKLKTFDNDFQEMKRDRNIIVHQGNFVSEELSNIDSKIFSPMIAKIMGSELWENLNKEKADKVAETKKKIEEQIDKIKTHVGEIFEQLPFYINNQIKIYELAE